MTNNMTVGVFFGGKSPEHDVSIITGQLILSLLKDAGYQTVPVYIDKTGVWFTGETLGSITSFTKDFSWKSKGLDKLILDLQKSRGTMVFKRKGLVYGQNIAIDLAFPAFHGMNGEDGTIQGLFEMFDIPYVGCDVQASAVAIDKVTTKLLYLAKHVPTVPFVSFAFQEWEKRKKETLQNISKSLPYPVMIKPARLGSSIGISKARNNKELEFALDVAFHYEDKVLVEKAIENLMDITCSVIGNNNPQPSLLQESAYQKDFFSYEDKYLKNGGAQLGKAKEAVIIPARLDKKTTEAIRDTAVSIFQAFGCSGIARVDFLYDTKAKIFYANEINTLPGTLYHHLWEKSGVEPVELVRKLVDFALEKHKMKQRLTYTFTSAILEKAGSAKLQVKAT